MRPLLLLLTIGFITAHADVPGVPIRTPNGPAAEAETDRWMKQVAEKGDHGGWLVVRGTHVGDNAVGAVTLGLLTHAVVLDKEKAEVIEAIAKGVVVTPLRTLLASAHRLEIVRPPGWTPEAGKAAVARARAHVGKKYDWLGLVGAENDGRYYCTELAVDAYQGRSSGWKLRRIIFPEDVPKLGAVQFDSGPRQDPVGDRFARRLENAHGVAYAAEVEPGLLRGGQPDHDGIAWLKSMGVKTILNLRHFHGASEREEAQAAGLRYEEVPLESSDAPVAGDVARIMKLLTDPSLRPLYVHCQHGVDRTGAMMAVYRIEHGWTNAEAFAEMNYFGAHRLWLDLRHFVRTYAPKGLLRKR